MVEDLIDVGVRRGQVVWGQTFKDRAESAAGFDELGDVEGVLFLGFLFFEDAVDKFLLFSFLFLSHFDLKFFFWLFGFLTNVDVISDQSNVIGETFVRGSRGCFHI